MKRFLDRLAAWWLSRCLHPPNAVARLYAGESGQNIEWCGTCGAYRRQEFYDDRTDVGPWWSPRARTRPLPSLMPGRRV